MPLSARAPLVLALALAMLTSPCGAGTADAQSLDSEVDATLKTLYETTPAARELAGRARGILVFPEIFREPVVVRVQSGNGALLAGGRIVGFYTASSIVYGLQPGALPFASVLFLMTDAAVNRLEQRGGWEVGKDPAVVVMSAGAAEMARGTLDTQAGTMQSTSGTFATRTIAEPDTYVFVLGDAGLMTGVDREGWRITKASDR
jgi:lipid-binding SYLF domain-containing protein